MRPARPDEPGELPDQPLGFVVRGVDRTLSPGVAPPDRLGTTVLPDGRRLGWSEWGPADGRPVLLCPGAATSRSLGFGSHVLDGLGVRLVSADRPGLGVSAPAPARDLSSWADDVAALVCDRELDRPAAVGYSQGAPFALAFDGDASLLGRADVLGV